MNTHIYQTKVKPLTGTDLSEIYGKARSLYKTILSHSRRKPYVRSPYFKKQKIFLELFWIHLAQKNPRERTKRLNLFPCAIDLIKYSSQEPTSKENPQKRHEILHRFSGITTEKKLFQVQIKENKKTGQKWFMSTFY